jgi:hypothetical protein
MSAQSSMDRPPLSGRRVGDVIDGLCEARYRLWRDVRGNCFSGQETGNMTGQIPDRVVYQEREYALAGIGGQGLFDPTEHGLQVYSITTACWRGYLCEYSVEDDQLFLTALRVGAAAPPDELFGAPVRLGDQAAAYGPIRVRQPFTGGLLLGAGFIEELYVHMGHQPAWKYTEVLELTFDDGRLVAVNDHLQLMARRRAECSTPTPTDPIHPTDPLQPDPWADDLALEHGYSPML